MKKDVNKKNKSFKKLKEELISSFNDKDYDKCLNISNKLMDENPKDITGYLYFIKATTLDYSKYIKDDELKELKKIFEQAYLVASKKDKENLKKDFDDYLYDLKEVDNLFRIRKEITGKLFLKQAYNEILTNLNHNINIALKYNINGIKIKSVYDFLYGIFLLTCLIFNIMNINYLLILTIPFGIFGLINIYSFLDMNFLSKGKIKEERKKYLELLDIEKEKVNQLKQEIQRLNDGLDFLNEQKNTSISKIPESFKENIDNLKVNDEKTTAKCILECLLQNNMALFTSMLESESNLKMDEVYNKGKYFLMKNSELSNYINDKTNEKKNNHSKIIYMKKITKKNLTVLLVTLFISVLSFILIFGNLSEINLLAFVISFIVGIVSLLIYNIEHSKQSSVYDTFKDNLILCIFNSSLVYNLIYSSIYHHLSFKYGFIKMPIIFMMIFLGFSMLISTLKYNYLLKKLRS